MKKIKIHISGMNDITNFVKEASKVDGPGVIVYKGSMSVDGSSLMGMLALDTSKEIEVEYPSSAIEFDKFITPFVEHE